jgi:hypothetical protein
MEGFEPPLPCENYALNVARLPIPPHRHNALLGPGGRNRTRTYDLTDVNRAL